MKTSNTKKFAFITFSLVLVALTRFLPHPPNFTAIGAVALFGGAVYSASLLRFSIPLILMFLTDLVINNVVYAAYYESFVWFTSGAVYIYGSLAIMVLLGYIFIKKPNVVNVLATSLLGSSVFFLITNLGVWASPTSIYPAGIEGLFASYAAGLPFFLNNVASTMLFSGVLFSSYLYVLPKLEAETIKVVRKGNLR